MSSIYFKGQIQFSVSPAGGAVNIVGKNKVFTKSDVTGIGFLYVKGKAVVQTSALSSNYNVAYSDKAINFRINSDVTGPEVILSAFGA